MSGLLRSRKFWVLIVDVAVSLVAYFSGKYAGPEVAEDVGFLILSLQPVFVAVIVGIFVEDAAYKQGLGAAEAGLEYFQPGGEVADVPAALALLRLEATGEAVEVLDELQAHMTEGLCQ